MMFWVSQSILMAARRANGTGGLFYTGFAIHLALAAVIGFPISMWGGYFFGRIMGWVFGMRT